MAIARAMPGAPGDPIKRERAKITAARALVHISRYTGRELSPSIVRLANRPLPQRKIS